MQTKLKVIALNPKPNGILPFDPKQYHGTAYRETVDYYSSMKQKKKKETLIVDRKENQEEQAARCSDYKT